MATVAMSFSTRDMPYYPMRGTRQTIEPPTCQQTPVNASYLYQTGAYPRTEQTFQPLHSKETALTKLANDAYRAAAMNVGPAMIDDDCCDTSLPFPVEDQFNQQFKDCPSVWINKTVKMYKKDPRVWQADLNESLYERRIVTDAEWDPYKHFHARQHWLQFATTDMQSRRDQYMRPIHKMEDSYAIQAERRFPTRNDNWTEMPVECIVPVQKGFC